MLVNDCQISLKAAKHHVISILFFLTQDVTFCNINRAKYIIKKLQARFSKSPIYFRIPSVCQNLKNQNRRFSEDNQRSRTIAKPSEKFPRMIKFIADLPRRVPVDRAPSYNHLRLCLVFLAHFSGST